jgi:hypothetical protein
VSAEARSYGPLSARARTAKQALALVIAVDVISLLIGGSHYSLLDQAQTGGVTDVQLQRSDLRIAFVSIAQVLVFIAAAALWRASDPRRPVQQGGAWREAKVPRLLGWWWAFYLLTWLASNYALRTQGDGADLGQEMTSTAAYVVADSPRSWPLCSRSRLWLA